MKKRILVIFIALICGISGYIIYHRLMDSKEVILNNTFYKPELDTIRNIRFVLKKKHADKKTLKAAFIKHITERVFPYWYGTKWDYNGTTEMPQKGSIACGYFVTTTLRDMGVPINRVKMAQCASEEMIKSLTSKKNIYHISGVSLKDFEKKLITYGNGLYIIGLDNHTGFLYLNGDEHWFIHSTGWFPFKVVKDRISESSVLSKSKYRVVGKISDDDDFLKRWVGND
ncbi:MAG: hypothetical protein V4580_19820 [Bacteroidota bacterium]